MTLEVPGDAYCYINCVFGFKMGWENSMRNQVAGQPWHKSAERHGPVYMEWGHYIAGERLPRLVYRPCTLSIGAPARVGDIMVESHWLYTCMFKIMLFVFFCEFKQCAHQCVLLDVANACHGCVCKQLTATAKHVGHCSAPYVFAFALSCLQTHSWHTHSTSHKIIETHMCKTRKTNICRGIGTDKNHMLLEIRYGECVPPRLRLTCGGLFKYMFFDGILARQHRCLLAHVLFCVFPRVVVKTCWVVYIIYIYI